MQSKLKVSVIVPVFNGSDFMAEAIDSVLAQSYANVEIIVVNDGSTDGGKSRDIARRYGARIRYFEQENKGVAGALNRGIAEMSGDIFCWLSHDDRFRPKKTAVQVQGLLDLNRNDVILYSDYALIDASGAQTGQTAMASIVDGRPELGLFRGCINGCTIFVPRRAFDEVGHFDENLRFTQDYDLWSRMMRHYSFVHVPEILVETRLHVDQDSKNIKSILEGDELWINLIESRSPMERALISGSNYRFLADMATFLDNTSFLRAANHAKLKLQSSAQPLVSIVIPFFNEPKVVRAVHSVLAQSHDNLEVILVDDGSTNDLSSLETLLKHDSRLKLISQKNKGPGAARNAGLEAAAGEYIVFLDADDWFLPHKIETQLRRMQQEGSLISHTSYLVTYPSRNLGFTVMPSGKQSGQIFPAIVATCQIAVPTVMIHSALVASGFRFSESIAVGEDCILWIEIAREFSILGIEEPLSVIEWSDSSAAINLPKSIAGLTNMCRIISHADYSSECFDEIFKLRGALAHLETTFEKQKQKQPEIYEGFVADAFAKAK